MTRIAEEMRARIDRTPRVMHSGILRARQTAEIFARVLNSPGGGESHAGLRPDEPAEPWKILAEAAEEDILIVSHLPFVAGLYSLLLGGAGRKASVTFTCGTTACLQRLDGRWTGKWVLSPEGSPW